MGAILPVSRGRAHLFGTTCGQGGPAQTARRAATQNPKGNTMFRTLLAFAFGATLGLGGVSPAAAASPFAQDRPAIGAPIQLVGHRHYRGHVSRGYHRGYKHRGYRHARPRYRYHGYHDRGYGHYRRHDHYRDRRHHSRYPAHGYGNAYPRGDGYDARQNYLRDRYGK
jgi:hypothetical protein